MHDVFINQNYLGTEERAFLEGIALFVALFFKKEDKF